MERAAVTERAAGKLLRGLGSVAMLPAPMAPAADKPALSEKEIDAPSVQTLIMLGVMALATLVFWAAGRAACNYHVPGESLTPRETSVEERTRFPKHVGIEFARAVASGNFSVAADLSEGEARAWVERQEKECTDCSRSREELLCVGVVEQANSVDSIVRVTTHFGQETSEQVFGIERVQRNWRVTRLYRDGAAAELKEVPGRSKGLPRGAPPMLRRPADESAP